MNDSTPPANNPHDVVARARASAGTSADAIYAMVARMLDQRDAGGRLIDVGCGVGRLWPFVRQRFDAYVGVDVVRYDGFPADGEFLALDLDRGRVPLDDATGDTVVAVETIEHLENPRAFVRELTRLTRPGGCLVVTTPNQLSALSLMTLLVKKQFAHFQDGSYPAHITALLEIDLLRMVDECGLVDSSIAYSREGRVIFTGRHYPRFLSRAFPRWGSDNLMVIARKP